MAITNQDALIAAMANSTTRTFWTPNLSAAAGNTRYWSLFQGAMFPGPNATPPTGAGEACTNSIGKFRLANAPGGQRNYLARWWVVGSVTHGLILYDRIWHNSGINSNLSGAQTINSVALPARAGTGLGVELHYEVYTQTGATAPVFTISYTNSDGVAGRTAPSQGAFANQPVGQLVPVRLDAGDRGVQSIQSITFTTLSGTAGNVGLTLLRPIAEIYVAGLSGASERNVLDLSMPFIPNDACLHMIMGLGSNVVGIMHGELTFITG